jgi:hypothetical protein
VRRIATLAGGLRAASFVYLQNGVERISRVR